MIVWVLVGLGLVVGSPALADEIPSWFAYRSDSLRVDICNVVSGHGQTMELTTFAPLMGQGVARERGVTTEYLVLPVILSEEPRAPLVTVCGHRQYTAEITVHHLKGGKFYCLAVYEARFKLKQITGFRYRGAELTLESRLR